ncbi:MAG: M15 family metallopeptidase [Lachnospiraceae bacterium]|nr:M15 family metallopeptidase [Lachnospiraceae bacterium]
MKNSPLPIKEILKYSLILLLVIAIFSVLSRKWGGKKGTLLDYEQARQESLGAEETPSAENDSADSSASLHYNGSSSPERVSYKEGFYYEPLSNDLISYITGISYPALPSEAPEGTLNVGEQNDISYADLRYVHIIHYDFDGKLAEGELICHNSIAEDLVEIFYDLYASEYQIEKVTLIENYNGDDTASMADNNTSCFNYRVVDGTKFLSRHALGLAIDINPLYNPYIRYDKKGGQTVSPVEGEAYADRTVSFPYKIDPDDLCYRLFTEHGFTWGGNWNSSKDYQHFQKALP